MKLPRSASLLVSLFACAVASKFHINRLHTEQALGSVAVCSFGGLRTFGLPKVHDSQVAALKILRESSNRLDFFMYATVQDEQPKAQACFDFAPVNADKEEAEAILMGTVGSEVDHVDFKFVETSGNFSEANVDALVSHREQCFSGGFWKKKELFVRSLNQWDHCNSCLKLITQREEEQNIKYESVVLLRPDIFIPAWDLLGNLQSVARNQTKVLFFSDWMALFNRKVMDRYTGLMETFKHCRPGEACCGAMGQGEDVSAWAWKGLDASTLCNYPEANCAMPQVVRATVPITKCV